jgi:NADPH-dependent 2,4-dienoyl-CoA reductase/sulfur reductase-like enzyme
MFFTMLSRGARQFVASSETGLRRGGVMGLARRRYAAGEVDDVVVIGGGPGGYVAAIKAAQVREHGRE